MGNVNAASQVPMVGPLLPLPRNPNNLPEVIKWADQIQKILSVLYQKLSQRTDEMNQQGLFTERPAATGRRKFYWSTDTLEMYYDDGAWQGPFIVP